MKHLKDYLALFSILAAAIFFFFYFRFNRQAQTGVVLATAAAYVIWGMIHHLGAKDFHWRILAEYLIVATLASLVVIFLLLRA